MRALPIIINFPYPIGYDSINYYLPLIYQFHSNGYDWNTLFPIYLLVVYFLSNTFWLDPYLAFNIINTLMYGALGVSFLFLFSKTFRMPPYYSIWSCVFLLLQLSLLRISWDLHRDILSIILFNVTVLIIGYSYRKNRPVTSRVKLYFLILVLSLLSVFTDRMYAILLIISSLIFALIRRYRYLFIINLLFIVLFVFYAISEDNVTFLSMQSDIVQTLFNSDYGKNSIPEIDLAVLFVTLNGVLIPFFVIGFVDQVKRLTYLIIPLLISISFSFIWLVVPNYEYLVPERWIILSSMFISVFAAYGLYLLPGYFRHNQNRQLLYYGCMIGFILYGIGFLVAPNGVITNLPSYFNSYTGFVFPLSMSMNSMEIPQNRDVINIIQWLNEQTPEDSYVIGTIHWRGWFQLFLNPSHKYLYSEAILENIIPKSSDLANPPNSTSYLENTQNLLCVRDTQSHLAKSPIYLIDVDQQHFEKNPKIVLHRFGKLNIYNASNMICNK